MKKKIRRQKVKVLVNERTVRYYLLQTQKSPLRIVRTEESGFDVHEEQEIFRSPQRPTHLSNQWVPGVLYAGVKRSGPSLLLYDVDMAAQTSTFLTSRFSPT